MGGVCRGERWSFISFPVESGGAQFNQLGRQMVQRLTETRKTDVIIFFFFKNYSRTLAFLHWSKTTTFQNYNLSTNRGTMYSHSLLQ